MQCTSTLSCKYMQLIVRKNTILIILALLLAITITAVIILVINADQDISYKNIEDAAVLENAQVQKGANGLDLSKCIMKCNIDFPAGYPNRENINTPIDGSLPGADEEVTRRAKINDQIDALNKMSNENPNNDRIQDYVTEEYKRLMTPPVSDYEQQRLNKQNELCLVNCSQ